MDNFRGCWLKLGSTKAIQMYLYISGIIGLAFVMIGANFGNLGQAGREISQGILIAVIAEVIATIVYCVPQYYIVCTTCTKSKLLIYCWTASRLVLLTIWFLVVIITYEYDTTKGDTLQLIILLCFKTGLELYFIIIVRGFHHEMNENPCEDKTELDEVTICEEA